MECEKINGIRQEDYRFDYIVISPNVEYYFFKNGKMKRELIYYLVQKLCLIAGMKKDKEF